MSRSATTCLIAAGVAVVLLAGCAVGPRYIAPRVSATAQGGFVSTDGVNAVAARPPAYWWRLYRDPVLDRLVGQALAENQDLKVAAANLAYAQGLLEEAGAGRFPSTDLTAGASYGRSAAQAAIGRGAAASYTAGFTAAYQIDLFGRVGRAIEAARANAQASLAAEDAVRVTVAAATASAYANICGEGEQLAVARRSLDLVQQTYDLTVIQRNAGALSDFDVDREAVLLDQAKAAIAPLEGQRRSALFTLAALLGATPGQIPAAAAACQTPPRLTRPLPVGDGAALLRRRPDVRAAERQLAGATARIGVATADLFPTVTIGAGASKGFGPGAGQIGGAGGAPGIAFSIGPLLTWSFPNLLVARARVRQAGALASAALASFEAVVLAALRETEQALATYSAELDHHAALSSAQTNADAAMRLAQIQYRAGTVNFLDLLSTQTVVVAASQALAVSDQAISSDQVAVFQALGGGWEGAPDVAPDPRPSR